MPADALSPEDKAVLAHLVEDADEWITRALDAGRPDWVTAKCRNPKNLAAYQAAKDKDGYTPRGPMPSEAACNAVDQALAAIEQARADAESAKQAQQDRLKNLFT